MPEMDDYVDITTVDDPYPHAKPGKGDLARPHLYYIDDEWRPLETSTAPLDRPALPSEECAT